MSRRLMVNAKCPICNYFVEEVPDGVLKKTLHYHNAELVVTKRGLKQYIHSSCWYNMIEEQKKERQLEMEKQNEVQQV